jgi:hypothetical protein
VVALKLATRNSNWLGKLERSQSIAKPQRRPFGKTAQEMPWWFQRRTLQSRPPTLAIDERHVKRGLQPNVSFSANRFQKRERLVVAAEQHVLTVIHPLPRLGIREGGGSSAECRARLEHQYLSALTRELDGCTEPGESATNDYDTVHRHW